MSITVGMKGRGTVLSRQEAQPKITTDLIGQQLAGVQELSTVEYFYTNAVT